MRRIRRSAAATLLVATAVSGGGCARNPATGEQQLSLISENQEIQMGQQEDQAVQASIGVYDDAALQRYVSDLGKKLAATSERPDLPWTFRVVDDPSVNAFALPGGFVYVTRGLLTHLTSEAELAGVMGHEIGHVTARHSVNQMSKQELAQVGLGLGMVLVPQAQGLAQLASTGLQLLFLKFSRDDESQADELGVRYMTRAGYDPYQMEEVMKMLERTSELTNAQGELPQWLSTHPSPANRVAAIHQDIAQLPTSQASASVVNRDPFLRQVDGVVFGDDPREGYFQNGVFYHPQLKFRFTFPSGWKAANGKQAVQAVSPNQDAAMEITLGKGSPAEALQAFQGQGVQILSSRQQTINGLPAVVAEFAASTQQGTLQGMAAFVSYGGNTYQILGYAAQGSWSGYANTVASSLGSFDRLTDSRYLNVKPKYVDVVSVSRSMPFSTFLRQYPSNAEPQIVALINQVPENGTLPGGTLAKRVTGGS